MIVPLVDIKKQIQSLRTEIDTAISNVLESGNFILGESVEQFENEFAKVIGTKYAVACNSGTSALHLALLASGVKPGDEVIVPSMTFVATVSAVIYAGAVPVLVDVDPDTRTMDPVQVEGAITRKTTAIMPVHLHGRVADMSRLMAIAKKNNLLLIEDAAQSHLATQGKSMAGGMGHVAGFSFYPGKNLGACGEGGILTTNNDEIAQNARILRDWGAREKYNHEIFGYNYRMDAIQGAILSVKLKHLDQWTKLRESAAEKYINELRKLGFNTPLKTLNSRHVFHVFSTLVQNRNQVILDLNRMKIGVASHYPRAVHQQLGFKDKVKVFDLLPNTEFFAEHNLSLPIFPEITDDQINFVVENLSQSATSVF